jgi:hypothetical protein
MTLSRPRHSCEVLVEPCLGPSSLPPTVVLWRGILRLRVTPPTIESLITFLMPKLVEPTGVEPATFSLRTRGANQEKRRFEGRFRKIPPSKGTDEILTGDEFAKV